MYSMRKSRPTGGFTLTEAAIVLGIMGLILGAVWVAAGAVYKNQRVTTASQQLLSIAQAVRNVHATQTTMDTSANMTTWVQSGIVPKDLVVNTTSGTTMNSWGGNVDIAAIGTGSTFYVSFSNIPQDACTEFMLRNSGNGRDQGLISVSVSSDTGGHNFQSNTLAVTPTEALGYCSNSLSNEVFFVFNLKG